MATVITGISWKNTYLFFDIASDKFPDIILSSKAGKSFSFTTVAGESEGHYSAHLNIASLPGSITLPQGEYSVSDNGAPVSCTAQSIKDILSLGRIFRYEDGVYALNCTFSCSYDDLSSTAFLTLRAEYMMKNSRPAAHRPFLEGKTPKKKLSLLVRWAAASFLSTVYNTARFFSHSGSGVLFLSETRDFMSDNLAALHTRLSERGLDKKYKIYTSVHNIFGKHRPGFRYWLSTVLLMSKCDYVFVDDYTPILNQLHIPKAVTIVQTWHAGFGFKLVGYGRFGYPGSPHAIRSSHRKYTYGVIGCEKLREIYSEVWGIDSNRLIPSGLPRLDKFFDRDRQDAARHRLYSVCPALEGRRYFLFAPTYRGLSQKSAYYDFGKVDFHELYKLCCESDITCVFKMHHFITEPVPIPEEYSDRLIEIKDININDAYYDAEFLITDYSSCFYDFVLLGKPVLFYVYDKDYYCATRGVHRPLEEVAPGKLCPTFSELLDAVRAHDFEQEKIADFFTDRCAEHGTSASDIIIDKVFFGALE